MDEEIRIFADARPVVPPYREEARRAARQALLDAAAGGGDSRHRVRGSLWAALRMTGRGGNRPPGRLRRVGWQTAGAFGVTLALVGGVSMVLARQEPPGGTERNVAAPLEESARVVETRFPELRPKPGQYVLIKSQTMYTAEVDGEVYLYRTERSLYRSADGDAAGLIQLKALPPKPYPGRSLPPVARKESTATVEWLEVAKRCPGWSPEARRDYAYLSTLPADPDGMRDFLYRGASQEDDPDSAAFDKAGDLVRETYMPKAQRQALFAAIAAIPGVERAEGVRDSAEREGVALGRQVGGVLMQLIFDPETFAFLGERGTVVKDEFYGAPPGSLVAHTAQTSVEVVDRLPEVSLAEPDSTCEISTPTAEPTPTSDGPAEKPLPKASNSPAGERVSGVVDGPKPAPEVSDGPAEEPLPKASNSPAGERVSGVVDGPAEKSGPEVRPR